VTDPPATETADGLPPTAPADGLRPDATADGLRHLHPLTPFLRGWAALLALVAIFGRDTLRELDLRQLAIGAAVLVPGVLGYGWLAWRSTRYGIVDGDLRHEQGILFRRSRRIRLDRLQSVDVVRPLVARALGLAELRLEVAGGSSPEAPLAYLSDGEARRLRAELLARAAGLHEETPRRPSGSCTGCRRRGWRSPSCSPRARSSASSRRSRR
jgi:putative membrane protein